MDEKGSKESNTYNYEIDGVIAIIIVFIICGTAWGVASTIWGCG